jgi:sugar (pentulose or hexulose) kinase
MIARVPRLGSGVFEAGVALDSMGTSESLPVVLDSPLEPKAAKLDFAQGCHVLKNRFLCFGGLVTSGAAVEWARDMPFPETSREEAIGVLNISRHRAHREAKVYISYPLCVRRTPPRTMIQSVAVRLLVVSIDGSPEDMPRSVFECLAYASFETLNALKSVFQVDIKQIRAVGGPTKNRLLMEVKAALAKYSLLRRRDPRSCVPRAAILAGLGIRLYKSPEDIQSSVEYRKKPIEAAVGWGDAYRERFDKVFRLIYPAVRDLQQQIIALESRTEQNATLSSHD